MTFGDKLIQFYKKLPPKVNIPKSFEWIDPFTNPETVQCMETFYKKYYDSSHQRTGIFGINPGRFGAGVTGVPFTDPKILEEKCGIKNNFHKRHELSAIFIYDWIQQYGSIESFYQSFFISSLCPLGFLTKGINCNYYDDKQLQKKVKPYIIQSMWKQIELGLNRKIAYSLGKGKNYQFFKSINDEEGFFDELVALPHPRWIMQYRRKSKDEILENMLDKLVLSQ